MGSLIAQYAAWNEYGVPAKAGGKKKWKIPSRPFMTKSVENYRSEINTTNEKLVKQAAYEKIDSITAAKRLGENQLSLIKTSIKDGNWKKIQILQ
jgi:hypothetical protein